MCFTVGLTLATRPKSKSFHQNNTKCERDASFQGVIDGVVKRSARAEPPVLSRLAGEKDYLLVLRSFMREAAGSDRQHE